MFSGCFHLAIKAPIAIVADNNFKCVLFDVFKENKPLTMHDVNRLQKKKKKKKKKERMSFVTTFA